MPFPKLPVLCVTIAIALAGIAPAGAAAKVTGPGKYVVTVKSTYVYKKPGVVFDGTLFKGNTFKVERVSKSGKLAYGFAYGHVNRHDWIKTSVLAKKK
jgi:hypothetical protein